MRLNGVKVSGQIDYFKDGVLTDYKVTSAWKLVDGVPLEWHDQLNAYALLLEENGITVKELQVVVLLRDWSPGKALGAGSGAASRDPHVGPRRNQPLPVSPHRLAQAGCR